MAFTSATTNIAVNQKKNIIQHYQITQQLPARSDSLHQPRVSMQDDDKLALLKHTIMQGWPSSIKQVTPVLQQYWTFREELTVEDGLIMKGTRIVVPN